MAAPVVIGTLIEGGKRNKFAVTCPYCRRRHEHAAGGMDESPEEFTGHRTALCVGHYGQGAGYEIRWDGAREKAQEPS
jgi:hypothetical protein